MRNVRAYPLRDGPDGFVRRGFDLLSIQFKNGSRIFEILGVDPAGWHHGRLASGLGTLGIRPARCRLGARSGSSRILARGGPNRLGRLRRTAIYGIATHD